MNPDEAVITVLRQGSAKCIHSPNGSYSHEPDFHLLMGRTKSGHVSYSWALAAKNLKIILIEDLKDTSTKVREDSNGSELEINLKFSLCQ